MEYIAIIISLIALVAAGFAFLRANSSHNILSKRIENLKDRNNVLEARLRKPEGNTGKANRSGSDLNEPGKRNQPRHERQEQQEPKQNLPKQKQPRPEQQPRQERPERQEQQAETRNEQRQKQREKQQRPEQQRPEQQPRQERPERQEQQRQERPERQERQDQRVSTDFQQDQDAAQQPQQKRRRENRRRNEPSEKIDYNELGMEQPMVSRSITLEVAGGDLLAELEQAAGSPIPTEPPFSGKKYAIIPEDGVIRGHQLQQQPDSDSYLEVDMPVEGNNITSYRFNLAGNHAFVIAQGIERLENAFDFEKPSNRMVNRVVQQTDGVLTKINNGWRIVEKARIDFR